MEKSEVLRVGILYMLVSAVLCWLLDAPYPLVVIALAVLLSGEYVLREVILKKDE